jgi:hypothetical protein
MAQLTPLKKLLLIFFITLSSIGLILSGFYLVVNLTVIPGKISKSQTDRLSEEEQSKKDVKLQNNSYGLAKRAAVFFEEISIDLSAVTPVILFMFFLFPGLGGVKLFKVHKKPESEHEFTESFPFPDDYQTIWIQLGFIGTLWAFLIIGYRMAKIKQLGGIELLDILIKAFGTALISTFAAVVMVYIVTPIVKNAYQKIFILKIPPPLETVEERLNKLSDQLNKTTIELEETRNNISGMNNNLNVCSSSVNILQQKIIELSQTDIIKGIEAQIALSKQQYEILKEIKSNSAASITKEERIGKSLEGLSENLRILSFIFKNRLDNINRTFKRTGREALESVSKKIEQSELVTLDSTKKVMDLFKLFLQKIAVAWEKVTIKMDKKIETEISINKDSLKKEVQAEINEVKRKFENIEQEIQRVLAQMDSPHPGRFSKIAEWFYDLFRKDKSSDRSDK